MSAPFDLERLRRLRGDFLTAGSAGGGPLADYWRDAADLEQYDAVFAQRIGWKWDAVLDELGERGLLPAPGRVVDFGCGSGIAARRFVARAGAERVVLHDRSALAQDFAAARLREQRPELAVDCMARFESLPDPDVLLISHVLDELDTRAAAELRGLVERSHTVLWVEAGTQAVSRRLTALRDELLDAGFRALAPCTHQAGCSALRDRGDDRTHWCHFFAEPPVEVFTDPDWVRLGRELGIDLRALPYCFVCLSRTATNPSPPAAGRLIGRPRVAAKLARYWLCDRDGLQHCEVIKTRDRALYRALKKDPPRLL